MKIRNRTEQNDWLFRLCWSLAAVFCSAPALSEPGIAGLYVLQTANGKGLPAAVAENKPTGYQLEVTGGWVALGADQTFTWRTAYRTTQQSDVKTSESQGKGQYRLNGSVISLTPDDNSGALEGTLTDATLTLQADVKLVYRKGTEPDRRDLP